MDAEPGVPFLDLHELVVSLHRFLEGLRVAAELVVEILSAVQRKLDREVFQTRLIRQNVIEGSDGTVREVAACRAINLFYPVVAYERSADFRVFLADERLAAAEVQILDRSEIARQFQYLIEREIVALIEVPPIETVLAREVADGGDEKDQEGRTGRIVDSPCSPRNPGMPGCSRQDIHVQTPCLVGV